MKNKNKSEATRISPSKMKDRQGRFKGTLKFKYGNIVYIYLENIILCLENKRQTEHPNEKNINLRNN